MQTPIRSQDSFRAVKHDALPSPGHGVRIWNTVRPEGGKHLGEKKGEREKGEEKEKGKEQKSKRKVAEQVTKVSKATTSPLTVAIMQGLLHGALPIANPVEVAFRGTVNGKGTLCPAANCAPLSCLACWTEYGREIKRRWWTADRQGLLGKGNR